MQPVAEHKVTSREAFESAIAADRQPVVMRSLVQDWPSVDHGRESASSFCRYVEELDSGTPVYTIAAPPQAGGRFFYSDDLKSLNFNRGQVPLSQVLAQILEQPDDGSAHSIAVQSLPIRQVLPEFERQNTMPMLDDSVAPTMWIGTRGKVAPHYDIHRNIACVVSGKRHFTLFPPEQIANLYPGPILGAPGGVPISLVNIWAPEGGRFPDYSKAMESAYEATLEPGDAIYIPPLWWHAVESLEPVNALVNYWWGGTGDYDLSPNDSLLHAIMAIGKLDNEQKQAWRAFFDYYVFGEGPDPAGHLPDGLEDIVTSLDENQATTVRRFIAEKLAGNR